VTINTAAPERVGLSSKHPYLGDVVVELRAVVAAASGGE